MSSRLVQRLVQSGWLNLMLFVATVASTFYVGAWIVDQSSSPSLLATQDHPLRGWVFAIPLLGILVTHELGHFLQARRHGVPASLPYFLPMPVPPLGTMGAVIVMRERIRTRNALLDIGASGPWAGMLVAIPVLCVGLRMSTLEPIADHGVDEGQSILYLLLKHLVLGPIPPGYDVLLHPTAFAGWAGLLMTMLNLLPIGQLDGGHVAFALLGPRHDHLSRIVHHGLLVLAATLITLGALRADEPGIIARLAAGFQLGAPWLTWWFVLGILQGFFRRGGHPRTDDDELSTSRQVMAWLTMILSILLFMPIPMSSH